MSETKTTATTCGGCGAEKTNPGERCRYCGDSRETTTPAKAPRALI